MILPPELRSCYEQGQLAGLRGERIDVCPAYRRVDKEAAWRRGWHRGQFEAGRAEVRHTDEEIAEAREAIAAIRAGLRLTEMPSGWVQDGIKWHRWAQGRTACGRHYVAARWEVRTSPKGMECPDCRFWLDWRAQHRAQGQEQPQGEESRGSDCS